VLGLAVGFANVLATTWSRPLETLTITNPAQTYRSDTLRTAVVGLAMGLAFGLTFGLTIGLAGGLMYGLAFGLTMGLAFGLAAGHGPAVDLQVMRLTWRLRGTRVRFMPLLQTAAQRQILRQAGAVYQFRHAALQDLFAGSGTPPA
jgi:hypothetical protein